MVDDFHIMAVDTDSVGFAECAVIRADAILVVTWSSR